ncbi:MULTISPECIES: dephospho-CoA kinase [Kamptonema]|uniref:dephospho-CoA kinase n=1 Tax=Kamptonema TaxID=1501433 RepID=UPI0001DAD22B|nr:MULTISPECIES: dephospho-CoA kinase [Kamptonema]CBN57689.1 dephospho-CoA kinase [Kamptonema sp. PCC 6506]
MIVEKKETGIGEEVRLIGLTGGIATGKTTVSNYLANAYQLPILDADIYAREAVLPETPILARIVERFGSEVLLADGSLNRRSLGNIVFNNSEELRWLEKQIHPYVRDRLLQEIKIGISGQNRQSIRPLRIVLAVPLLFEANMTDLVTEIWVVYCPRSQQLERLVERDRINLDRAQTLINSQMLLVEKCQQADVILDNSTTLESLFRQVDLVIGNW